MTIDARRPSGDPSTSDFVDDEVTSDADVLARLESFVRKRLGPDAIVDGFTRVSTGRSRQNWLFDAVWSDDGAFRREALIVRRDPLGGLLETNRAEEFAMLRALQSARVPTPEVRWLDATGDELGRPCLVMARCGGSCDYYALNSAAPLEDRIDLAQRLCSLLADVHAVDWAGIGISEHVRDPGTMASLAALEEWEAIADRDRLEPYPELDLGARWLRENAPRSPRTVLVHGDFKVGNVLLDAVGNIVALLDWETAHLGDPHEDLGWVTQPLRTKEHYIRGSWEREQLLDHYERASGHAVDHDAVGWWNVFATYKTAVMQISGLRAFREGRSDEHYQPSAPVLTALLKAVLGHASAAGSVLGSAEWNDREAFLQWDTAKTLALLPGDDAAALPSPTHPEATDPEATDMEANHRARAALSRFIRSADSEGSTPPDDALMFRIGTHLLTRVSEDPALARRTR